MSPPGVGVGDAFDRAALQVDDVELAHPGTARGVAEQLQGRQGELRAAVVIAR